MKEVVSSSSPGVRFPQRPIISQDGFPLSSVPAPRKKSLASSNPNTCSINQALERANAMDHAQFMIHMEEEFGRKEAHYSPTELWLRDRGIKKLSPLGRDVLRLREAGMGFVGTSVAAGIQHREQRAILEVLRDQQLWGVPTERQKNARRRRSTHTSKSA